MARMNFLFVILCFTLISHNIFADTGLISVRTWPTAKATRIVLDLNKSEKKPEQKAAQDSKIDYSGFVLDNPNRFVVDLKEVTLNNKKIFENITWGNQIDRLRYSNKNNLLRLVFDLKSGIEYKLFLIPPVNKKENYRLVIDLKKSTEPKSIVATNKIINTKLEFPDLKTEIKSLYKPEFKPEFKPELKLEDPMPRLTSIKSYKQKKFTVVIDPGHGGDDPGAIGQNGTQEKEVVLAVANHLKEYLDQDPDLKAVLTRSGDYYLGLRDRTAKARQHQADLFVSIHADGFHNARASGSSVFVLSERGASSELAKWLADSENSSDLVGGVHLENKDAMLTTVLLDLSQTASNRSSYQVANKVLQQMSVVTDLHKARVEKAGFMVLRSPDIPSILVETGFISNPQGERNLSTVSHQKKLAYAIYKGIKAYFKMTPKASWSDELIQARR
ncbi:MAG: N-acetylmuramoyl-L-alanine amidase [Gammaproteobacteria bacterium]|nr:N-acetylmuramoyl-L-alanine amidase [Gammaproteobacteria bacterium]